MPIPSLLYGSQAQAVYREMFCRLYHRPFPDVPLDTLLHWKHRILNLWGLTHQRLHHEVAYIPKGYFYSIHTPMLSPSEIEAALTGPFPVTLIPYIREGVAPSVLGPEGFEKLGFVKLPWCYEAIYQVHQDVDTDLQKQLGTHRYKRILSTVRKAEADYDYIVYDGAEASTPDVLQTFTHLHNYNALKYKHGLNTYASDILEMLASSPLKNHIVIDISREKETGTIVQSSLSLICRSSGEMILLAQGIDHDRVPHSQNLYLAQTYQLYQWGTKKGIHNFNLGRDAPLVKRDLGANQFFLLENYIHTKDVVWAPEVIEIKELAQKRLEEESELIKEKGFKKNRAENEEFWILA